MTSLKIPLENFLNPYEVYFTEKDDISLDQIDKIRKTEFSQDETHVNLSFRTFGDGTVSIVGATPEEHQKRLEQIENVKSREVKSTEIEEETEEESFGTILENEDPELDDIPLGQPDICADEEENNGEENRVFRGRRAERRGRGRGRRDAPVWYHWQHVKNYRNRRDEVRGTDEYSFREVQRVEFVFTRTREKDRENREK